MAKAIPFLPLHQQQQRKATQLQHEKNSKTVKMFLSLLSFYLLPRPLQGSTSLAQQTNENKLYVGFILF